MKKLRNNFLCTFRIWKSVKAHKEKSLYKQYFCYDFEKNKFCITIINPKKIDSVSSNFEVIDTLNNIENAK